MLPWQPLSDLWLLRPAYPLALVHVLGGAFVGGAPQLSYNALLQSLAAAGFAIAATPYATTPDHRSLAIATYRSLTALPPALLRLPRYGLGHSLGCKLHLIATCYESQQFLSPVLPQRHGNILIALSNASMAVPLAAEFDPSPSELRAMTAAYYDLPQTLIVRFDQDDIDDSHTLTLSHTLRQLPGNHVTPLASDAEADRLQRTVSAWLKRQVFSR